MSDCVFSGFNHWLLRQFPSWGACLGGRVNLGSGFCCDPQKRPRFWLELSARFSLAGRAAETHKSIEVQGRAEGVHHQSERGRYDRFGGLPLVRDQPNNVLQLEEEVREYAVDGYEAASRAG